MNHFKEVAKNWDTNEKAQRNKVFADAIKKYLTKDCTSFIDFGCGTGLLSEYFAHNSTYLLGVDTTKEMLSLFDKKFEKFDQVESCTKNLEVEDFSHMPSEIGAVFSAMAFHHLNDPVVVLSKLKNVMSKNGKVFVIDLFKEDGSFHPDNDKMGVKHFGFDQEDVKRWSKELDLNLTHFEIVFNINKNERDYPIFMAVLEK